MLGIPYLRNILSLSLVLAIALPLYVAFVINPGFDKLLAEETEGTAIRYVSTLISSLGLGGGELTKQPIPPEFARNVDDLRGDLSLIKLRLFSPAGEIIFSTDSAEIGTVNTKPYFRDRVARGQVYSKVVREGGRSAEGATVVQTVVETYVPLMRRGVFEGAVETYFDITASRGQIDRLNRQTAWVLWIFAGTMLLGIILALRTAQRNIAARDSAEQALRQSKEDLEKRVEGRTEQILEANRLLTSEIAVRRHTEEAFGRALAESEQAKKRIDGILRSVPDGLLAVDGEGRLLLLNPTAASLLGLTPETALGHPLGELLLPPLPVEQIVATLHVDRVGAPLDILLRTADNGSRVFQARTSLLPGSDNGPGGVIVLMHEVTREREMEQAKRDFITMAAHELHSPLMVVRGYAELLSTTGLATLHPNQQQEILDCIHDQSRILTRLVDDLLEISRMESGQGLALHRAPVSIEDVVRTSVTAARADSRFRFELELQPASGPLCIDRGRIQQVLANLLGNAAKYAPEGDEIRISGATVGNSYRITVTDRGPGMSPEQQRRVFDKFYRGSCDIPDVRGTGLGLTIARAIVEEHGGSIALSSAPGQGTSIWFDLPLASAAH